MTPKVGGSWISSSACATKGATAAGKSIDMQSELDKIKRLLKFIENPFKGNRIPNSWNKAKSQENKQLGKVKQRLKKPLDQLTIIDKVPLQVKSTILSLKHYF